MHVTGDRRPPDSPVQSSVPLVLVVDDDPVIRELICVNLELEGFRTQTAVDGLDAVDQAIQSRPDVITLDVMMPRLDGWDTAARLRADPRTAGCRVVLLSARAQAADLRRGEGLGVDAYLTKPFDPADLVETVRALAAQGFEHGDPNGSRPLPR